MTKLGLFQDCKIDLTLEKINVIHINMLKEKNNTTFNSFRKDDKI